MLKYLARVLQSRGYAVADAISGAEALAKLAHSSYDLMLLDIVMPGMDGIEVLRRAQEISPQTVVLVMTGYSSLQHATEAIQHGAYRLLTKPFSGAKAILEVVDDGLAYRASLAGPDGG
jgi:CheY-like chemotaxis protein